MDPRLTSVGAARYTRMDHVQNAEIQNEMRIDIDVNKTILQKNGGLEVSFVI